MSRKLSHLTIGLLALLSLTSVVHADAWSKAKEFKQGSWEWGCEGDHKNQYGEVLPSRKCWMRTNKNVVGDMWANVITISKGRVHFPASHRDDLCDPLYPSRIAVDGNKVDGMYDWEDEGYVRAVLQGKHIIYEAWKAMWPQCDYKDVEADLSGAPDVFRKIIKLAPECEIEVPDWAKALAADVADTKKAKP